MIINMQFVSQNQLAIYTNDFSYQRPVFEASIYIADEWFSSCGWA